MAKSEIEKRSQAVEDLFNEIQSYLMDKVLKYLPMGDELNLLLNARSNIRKERLSRFFESFRDELKRIYGKPLDKDEITSEEFIDVMEAIIIKVQSTQSSYKAERFRNILLRQVIDPIDHQLTLKYINIIDELTDVQMVILSTVSESRYIRSNYDLINLIWRRYNPDLNIADFDSKNFLIKDTSNIMISSQEVRFYLTDLISKGLIENSSEDELSIPNMKYKSWPSHSNQNIKVQRKKEERYTVTLFGTSLLDFIKNQI